MDMPRVLWTHDETFGQWIRAFTRECFCGAWIYGKNPDILRPEIVVTHRDNRSGVWRDIVLSYPQLEQDPIAEIARYSEWLVSVHVPGQGEKRKNGYVTVTLDKS